MVSPLCLFMAARKIVLSHVRLGTSPRDSLVPDEDVKKSKR